MTGSEDERRLISNAKRDIFVKGNWIEAGSGQRFAVTDPSTAEPLCTVADASEQDARNALDACASAQSRWASTAPRERAEILRRTFEIMMERREELALLITLENGKPLAESRAEIAYGADFFRWFSEEAVRIDGRYTVAPAGRSRSLVMKQPVGPCLLITPWNFPIAMGCRKIAPAAAAGCTMISKPAEQTPLSMLALAAILDEAGLPPGVLNVLPTSRPELVTGALIDDPRLRKLSFTGSTEIGKLLVRQSANNLLRLSMELGGNAPFLVFQDADIEKALEGAVTAKMRNAGQTCVAANRFHVHESLFEEFSRALAAKFATLRVGRGADAEVAIGPLIDESGKAKVLELVSEAQMSGARPLFEPGQIPERGYFVAPSVIVDVPTTSRLLHEEIFGPVAPVVSFRTEDEAIAAANNTRNGLVAYLYTDNLTRAIRVMERLEVGMVGVNRGFVSDAAAPFGGIKHSGFGREGGREGIDEYLDVKYAALETPE